MDRQTDRAWADPLWLLLALSYGDHWADLRALEGTTSDSPGLLGTCEKGSRFLFIFPFTKTETNTMPNYSSRSDLLGLGS